MRWPASSSGRGPATSARHDYIEVDAFYHQLCPDCAAINHSRRDARTDLTGRRALLTGGRAKIGMYIALRLLRDGAHTTITTRFPGDAVRRFTAMPDSADWLHRLRIVGIDLRDPAQVVALADSVAEAGPLDILINNAAQTVRRSPGAYAPLAAAESDPLPDGPLPELLTFDHISDAHPHALAGSLSEHPLPHLPDGFAGAEISRLALLAGSASAELVEAGRAIDAGGLVPDLQPGQQLDPAGQRGRPAGAAGGAAVQHDGAVHPGQPAAGGAGGQSGHGASTSSTSRRWRASSAAATRVRATRTPTWPRPR